MSVRLIFNVSTYASQKIIKQNNFRFDNLTIFNGNSNESPIIGQFCGDSMPTSQVSSGNEAFIVFKTDHWGAYSGGFKIEYEPLGKEKC